METTIRVCATRNEIAEKVATYPDLIYEVTGYGKDFVVKFFDVDESNLDDIMEDFSDVFYGDEDKNLSATLVELLYDRGLIIATAESCTGGMIASSIVDVAGCSDVFHEGVVTYSNLAKMDRLGVKEDTLIDFGAVSRQTAGEMANGLLSDNVSVGVSTTGIAGPGGGSIDKPVGLVYIAVASNKGTDVYKCIFDGDRKEVRTKAKDTALFYAIKHIQKNYNLY